MSEQAMPRFFDILLVGVGGQGVLTIAEFLTRAAFAMRLPVNYYPSKGMAQRGGFVKAQVRLGRDVVGPNIPEHGADLVIALERSEALKAIRFVKPGGEFVLYDDVWAPTAVMLGKAAYPTSVQVQEQVHKGGGILYDVNPGELPAFQGQPVPDNVFLLGFVLGHTRLGRLLDRGVVAQSVRDRWVKAAERNLHAFNAGLECKAVIHAPCGAPAIE